MDNYKRIAYDSPYKGLSVLVVDDFDAITRTLCSAFEQLGFKTIHQAKDGFEAWQCLERQSVDMIISDWKMPKMDGLTLLKRVRGSHSHQHIPFIMLTGNLHQSDVVEAIQAGVSEYLVKPFSKATLSERVHKAFVSPIRGKSSSPSKTQEPEQDGSDAKELKRTILVVDDEPSNLQVLGELLKPSYKIKVCRSGAQAIEICAKAEKPDLILLDIMMPEMDGLAVCRALKSQPDTEFIPIIFVSALSQTDDVVKGLKLGAVDYIMKPVIPEIVMARVATHINSVVQREKLTEQVEQLIQASRQKEEARQMFFHDLRNPLSAIQTTLTAIQGNEPEINSLKESVKILSQMVENHQLLMALEQGEYTNPFESITLESAIQSVISSYQSRAQEKQLEIKIDIDPSHRYLGDELLSYTMFSNLIVNAIEAAPIKSAITVSSTTQDEYVMVSLQNVGEVPLNIRDQFFDKYASANKSTGTGVGSYSARLCAQAQNGDINLNAEQPNSTTIMVQLQAANS